MMPDISFLKKNLNFLYISVFLVYIVGLSIPLMENDAAQHASMAMKMVLDNDFFHIYKGSEPYLDKPHLHFWLSAFFMKVFGINHIAYRIPALLFLFIGAYYTFKLTLRLYKNNTTAHWAALIYLSAQTIILSGHDVRTDSILTGAIILALYNIIAFIEDGKIKYILLGGLGTAMALGSKGMVGVGIIGLFALSYLLYSRNWRGIFRWKILFGLLSFIVGILPVLYAYYVQFDLHPELVIHGRQNVSGVRFILWDQSFNRFSGEDFGEVNPDYFFFFHTLLWVFIPFSVVLYGAIFSRTAFFVRSGFKKIQGYEFLTTGGFWLVMLFFSFSKFKLPHYLNSLVAMLSVLTASYLFELYKKNKVKETKFYLIIHCVLLLVGLVLMVYLTKVVFGIQNYYILALVIIGILLIIKTIFSVQKPVRKLFYTGVLFAITLNLFLNSQFYPPLSQYQAGLQIANQIIEHKLNPRQVIMPENYTNWTLDFYTATNIRRIPQREIYSEKGKYLFIKNEDLRQMQNKGLEYKEVFSGYQYRITKLKANFLNPKTREKTLEPYVLVRIK